MANSKYSLKKAVAENPEAACELAYNCVEAIASVLPDKTKQVIKEKVGRSCEFIGSKFGEFFSQSQESNKLHGENNYQQTQDKGFSGPESYREEDYGNQLEAFMPMAEVVYEMSASLELVWEKGNKESCYVSSFTEDDTEYDCQIFLGGNSRAILEVDVYNDDELEDSFSIGRDLYPIHPVLNKKLSDLFFLVEDAVLNNKYAETSQKEASLDSLPASHKKILIFLGQIANLTEKKSLSWQLKGDEIKKYRALLKKADGTVVVVELISPENGSIECRAAKIIDKKLTKMFCIAETGNCYCIQIYDEIKRLHNLVEKGFV